MLFRSVRGEARVAQDGLAVGVAEQDELVPLGDQEDRRLFAEAVVERVRVGTVLGALEVGEGVEALDYPSLGNSHERRLGAPARATRCAARRPPWLARPATPAAGRSRRASPRRRRWAARA